MREPPVEGGSAWLVARAIELIHAHDEQRSGAQRAVIELLSERSAASAAELRRRYAEADPLDIPLRWTLLYLTGLIMEPETVAWLVDVACESVPEDLEPVRDPGCGKPSDGEVLVRVMATEAVMGLGQRRRDVVMQALLTIVEQQPHVAIRAVAGQALLDLDPDLRPRIHEILPEEQRFIVDLRRVPHTHLTADPGPDEGGKGETPRPPKMGDGDRAAPAAPR